MKIKITMKDPEALFNASIEYNGKGLTYDNVVEYSSKWFKYREYVTLEIDTETETIRVLEAN